MPASKLKVALITGGSRGLGKNICQHLAARGTGIILTYKSNQAEAEALVAEITAGGGKAAALALDVADSASFAGFAAQVKETLQTVWARTDFDFLVNNAGIGLGGAVADMKEEDFDLLVKIHFKAPFFLTQKLLPLIKDGGRIINISSGLTRFTMPGYAAYGSLKAGIEVLSRYMAREFGPRGIRVNTIAPGAIETDFGGGAVRDNQAINKAIAGATALGRVGLPDDVGGAVAALLDESAGWINAQRIEVSGGVNL